MSDTKIFSLGDNGMGGGNNMLAMLPALLQRQGVDPNLVALCQGRGQNGWGGDGIFGILLLFILMGAFNGNGFGFGGGNHGCWGGNGYGNRYGNRGGGYGGSGGGYGNRMGYRDEEWDDEDDDFGERRGRSSRTGRYVRR